MSQHCEISVSEATGQEVRARDFAALSIEHLQLDPAATLCHRRLGIVCVGSAVQARTIAAFDRTRWGAQLAEAAMLLGVATVNDAVDWRRYREMRRYHCWHLAGVSTFNRSNENISRHPG